MVGQPLGRLVGGRVGRAADRQRAVDDQVGGLARGRAEVDGRHAGDRRRGGDRRQAGEAARVEGVGQRGRVLPVQLGRPGLGRRLAHRDPRRLAVPHPHLDVRGDVRGRQPRQEGDQVEAELQGRVRAEAERTGDRAERAAQPAGVAAGRLAEEELATGHAGLVSDLPGPLGEEVPVGLRDLGQVHVRGAGGVDGAGGQAVLRGELAGDVGVLHVHEGPGPLRPLQPVRLLVPAHHRQDDPVVADRLDRGDLTGDQRGRRSAGRGAGDLDRLADRHARVVEHRARLVEKRQLEHVRQVQVGVHHHPFQLRQHVGPHGQGEQRRTDLDARQDNRAVATAKAGNHARLPSSSSLFGRYSLVPGRTLDGLEMRFTRAIWRHSPGLP